jgi:hypothetical protein
VRRELSKAEVERLFIGAIDGALPKAELDSQLGADPALQGQFDQYQRAVTLLRGAPKEKAPEALASVILRRTRRRRFAVRGREVQLSARFPIEVVVPMVIAVLVAMFLLLATP